MRSIGLCILLTLPLGAQERRREGVDPETALKRFQLAPGTAMKLWAAEPDLANPVAIAFDERGRVYVAECWRRHTSLLDIHMRREWLDDDLACRKHEDLVEYHKRRMGERAAEWTRESERIRILEDKDGDGKADAAATFSEGYAALGEGIGAGLLVRNGDVWYTCIPNLWLLRDADGDGKADQKKALHTGFGVHLGASGHDMHGLVFGPDGKIYWSHGDRGFRVEAGGKVHDFPDGGGVFRANPDGTDFEVVCVGLRNPQELAFDEYGNLFTGDNNISKAPDVGETCRWTYVVEGADYGWRIGYQFMPTGGAWCAEDQWRLEAGYQVPYIARLGHGPSGVAYHPGVAALPERYQGHFFMCDYPGGIYAFRMVPRGAGFEMAGLHKLLWDITAPDADFGPDGALYVADWVGLWDKVDKGRIWRLADPEAKDPALAEVKRLIAEGMAKRPAEELAGYLAHRDQRIRQNAQFELAARKDAATLARRLDPANPRLARIHAVWGLGQLGRRQELLPLLADADAELRAQAAKTLGNLRVEAAGERFAALLKDESPRVRYFAAIGLGKIGRREAVGPLVDFLRADAGADRFLQHAGIMGLAWIGDAARLAALADDASASVRMAALVALRKLRHPDAARFLSDPDRAIAFEAARAIYDEPIPAALPALVREIRSDAPERHLLRQLNAAHRLGRVDALAVVAAGRPFPAEARIEAMQILAGWDKPSGRDRLMGIWRPVPAREREEAVKALEPRLDDLLQGPPEVVAEAAKLSVSLKLPALLDRLSALGRTGQARAAVLAAAAELGNFALVAESLDDADPAVRRAAARLAARAKLPDAPARLEKLAKGGPVEVRQAAIESLGALGAKELLAGIAAPPGALLELAEALQRPVEAAALVEGGDAASGRRIFYERSDVQCVRCHKAGGAGGEVGPELGKIGGQKTREYLLESILEPSKAIAEGWGQTAFLLDTDAVEVGRIERETDQEVTLLVGDGGRRTLAKSRIKARKPALSAMPEEVARPLSKRDLRDLVEFLAGLR
jgi:quinoprotein glucose dehydrogenase